MIVIALAAAILCAALTAPPDEAPVSGDCAADPVTLAGEARALLAETGAGAEPAKTMLRRAHTLRRARKRAERDPRPD